MDVRENAMADGRAERAGKKEGNPFLVFRRAFVLARLSSSIQPRP